MADRIENLLGILEKNEIAYVHWKSNTNIEKALSGEDDLDLLVDPKKKRELYELFEQQGIIRGYSSKDAWQNEIFHYFGMDMHKKELVHIHLHFLLEVGYDFDKSVNLPVVQNYLQERYKYRYVYLPIVEHEYIVLLLRLLLKHAFLPFALMLPPAQWALYKNQKKGVVNGSAYAEFKDLNYRADREKLDRALSQSFPFIDKALFYRCEEVLSENTVLKRYFSCAKALKKALLPYTAHSEWKSFLLSFYRINQGRLNKLLRNKAGSKKIPENGGRIFAFVGGDGAGKSTNIEKLSAILKKHFYTKTLHIGRPRLHLVGTMLLIASKLCKILGDKDLRQALVYLAIAYGRSRGLKEALKIRAQGGIVILDRMPLEGISSMDCPRIHTISDDRFKRLSAIEKKMHTMTEEVDALIVLKLDPMIALQRRSEDDPAELLIRSGQIWDKDFSQTPNAHVINTENSFAYVEERILKTVWASLNQVQANV